MAFSELQSSTIIVMSTTQRSMAVGVQLPEIEWPARWPDLREISLAVEGLGFDSIWIGDHLLYDTPDGPAAPWEAWSLLAAIAAITERVQLGPLVAATSFHSPPMLAKKATTVDEISGGRLILGLGAGWNEVEYRAFGFPFDHRASRFEEAFTIIRTLLTEGEIDFDGEYYTARDCQLVPRSRPEGPPIMIGSMGPRVLRATLPYVDLWNTWHAWHGNTPEGFAKLNTTIDDAAREVGRDPSEIGRTTALYWQFSGGGGRRQGDTDRHTADPRIGTPEELAEALRSYESLGADHVQLVLDPITIESVEAAARALDLLRG
jgi:alkanesulfonate monooxygenase SsuD/methylene tetrahydromethanopterin reductase-like flavin-dependent oxidoreductase (luciferase family)